MSLRTEIVAADTDAGSLPRTSMRRGRYTARGWLRRESTLRRVQTCGRWATGDAVSVKVSATADGRRAGLGGVVSCGSVWACPVCSEKVNAGRQAELSQGMRAWHAKGGAVLFGTLTLRHNKGDRLKDLLAAVSPAWNRTTSGAGAQWNGSKPKKDGTRSEIGDKRRFGIAGYVRLEETKHGDNGWHPHLHFLLFLDAALSSDQVADLQGRMFGRWETALADQGYSVLESVGIDLRPVMPGDQLADYFAKGTYTTASAAAYEVTGSHSKKAGKGGRTPFELLGAVVEQGDADALDLWHEWERASKGRRQLTWSRGLRALLALEVEKTDQQLVDDADLTGTEEASIGKRGWKWIAKNPQRVCDLLEAVEADASGWEIHRLLAGWGLQVLGGERSASRRYDLP